MKNRRTSRNLALSLAATLMLLLWCVVITPAAWAQVALPRFIPGAPTTYNGRFPIAPHTSVVPQNPAALQWGYPSRFVVGSMEGSVSHGDVTQEGTTSGQFFGFRFAGETVALALDQVDYALESDFNLPVDKSATAVAFSFRAPESYAYGLSVRSAEMSISEPGNSYTLETDNRVLGISIRLSDAWYVGLARGSEDVTRTFPAPAEDYTRDISMMGLGFRSLGGIIWHFEVSTIEKTELEDGLGNVLFGHKLNQAILESAFWNLVWSYRAYRLEGTGTFQDRKVDGLTIDAGFAPFEGITLTGRYENSTSYLSGVKESVEDLFSFHFGWQF